MLPVSSLGTEKACFCSEEKKKNTTRAQVLKFLLRLSETNSSATCIGAVLFMDGSQFTLWWTNGRQSGNVCELLPSFFLLNILNRVHHCRGRFMIQAGISYQQQIEARFVSWKQNASSKLEFEADERRNIPQTTSIT